MGALLGAKHAFGGEYVNNYTAPADPPPAAGHGESRGEFAAAR